MKYLMMSAVVGLLLLAAGCQSDSQASTDSVPRTDPSTSAELAERPDAPSAPISPADTPVAEVAPIEPESNEEPFAESSVVEMWVAPYTKTCNYLSGECLLVSFNERRPTEDAWQLMTEQILDFDYEKGYLYRLKVRVDLLNPDALLPDAGIRQYVVLEVLQKDGA
ncbi:MAG: DUF4377 domain-containing protein [Bacteroidota bacterium]